MADATIDLQASNLFSLHSNFKTSSSGTSVQSNNVTVMDESGNVSCETNIFDITNYTQSAGYCGTDFLTDLGTFATQFGTVQGSKIVTGVSISMSAGEYCTIDVEGHNHDENAHAAGLSIGYADVSDFLPHEVGEAFAGWNGFGVPDFGITLGDNASPISATVSFAINHVDQIDEAGDHLVGKNITPRCELSMDFSGIPTSLSGADSDAVKAALLADFQGNTSDMLGAICDTYDKNDGNSEFDSSTFTAHAHASLATE